MLYPHDDKAKEALAQYMARYSVSLKKLVYECDKYANSFSSPGTGFKLVVQWYFKIVIVVFNTPILVYNPFGRTPVNHNYSGLYRLFQYFMFQVDSTSVAKPVHHAQYKYQ